MLSVDAPLHPQQNTMEGTCEARRRPFDDPISKEDVEIVVKRAFGPKAKLVNHHVRMYSQERLGFLGDHRHLVVTVQREGQLEQQIHTFFLKTVPRGNEVQASLVSECQAFYKETGFYRKILPELLKSVKDNSWVPTCYLVKDDLLVFEDLKSKDFNVPSQLLDMNSLKSALGVLAQLHASSMLTEKRLGKTFLELYPDIMVERQLVRTDLFGTWIRTGFELAAGLARTMNLNSAKILPACDRIFDLVSTSKTSRNVTAQGDAKSFNFMYKILGKPLPKCVIFDFQLVRYTTLVADLLQVIYLTTRREFRDKYEEELLNFYTEALTGILKENDPEMEAPTAREIIAEYNEKRLIGIVTLALYAPTHFMDTLKCAEITKDSAGFDKMISGDRLELVLDVMQEDAFYKEIMTEIIEELVERSEEFVP